MLEVFYRPLPTKKVKIILDLYTLSVVTLGKLKNNKGETNEKLNNKR